MLKKHYQSFIRKQLTKSVKQSKVITHQQKTCENPNTVDTKLIITEHPKAFSGDTNKAKYF